MKQIKVKVEGMMCAGCETRIQNALKMQKEVEEVKANHNEQSVVISLKEDLSEEVIRQKIENLGFTVKELEG